jgi:hypothetical protein
VVGHIVGAVSMGVLSRPLSLSLVAAARRAPRRTTPAVVGDARHEMECGRWWRSGCWGGAASYGVGESMAAGCCAQRNRAMWWNDVPRGTMDKVSSYVCLDPHWRGR